MGKSQHTIDINANIKTQLQGMDKVIREFQNGLSNGMSKIDMTKGVGKDLSKLISKFENDFSKINSLISLDNKISLGDSKEFQKYGDSIISVFRDIQRVANDLGQKGLIDAKKLFPEAFDSKVSEMLSQLGRLKSSFIELAQKESSVVKLQGEINDLTSKITELKTASDNFDSLKQNFEEATQQVEEATKNVEALKKSIIGLAQKKLLDDGSLEDTEEAAKALREELEKLKSKGVTTGKSGHATFNGKNMTEWRAIEKEGTDSQKQQAKEVIELLKEYNLLNNELRTHNRLLEENARLRQLLDNGGPSNKKDVQDLAKIVGEKDAVKEAYTKQAEAADKAAAAQEELNKAEGAAEQTVGLAKKLDEKNQKLRETEAAIKALKTATDFSQIAAELNKIEGIKVDESMLKSTEGLARVVKQLEGLDEKAYSELKETLQSLGITLPDASQNVKEFGGSLEEAGDKAKELDDNLSEMKALKSRITQFFGLTNAINLFKRTVSNAINSVKELDAVMTETAVVTDFSVGDMWEKLPEYASHASDLGASIRDVYAATTLYYQQGLKTNEAMSVGVETMKMARIANIEAGDATQYMTAALRGFNMEVNEMNAERVNDVYSELAAITAADTAQIATAMSKTASIAASANMEFETTAALLAQIIETTQEAPETAGTAMKTIIARFAEVKKLREEGQETGEDEEGEIIDVNKIQGALREVGISMEEFFAGTEGLDSILLKLAENWSDLDFETQRYIATTAAGSRQQSRFIAMMSDYGRTMELAAAANNSAGASQKQFDKTLESLDAKVQKLSAAWQEFTMGLANSEIIKFGVDALTFLLKAVNKVVDALSGKNGIAKSVITLNLAITAIGGVRAALHKLFNSKFANTVSTAFKQISEESKKSGITAGQNVKSGIEAGLNETVQISREAGLKAGQAYTEGFNSTQNVSGATSIDEGSDYEQTVMSGWNAPKPSKKPPVSTPTQTQKKVDTKPTGKATQEQKRLWDESSVSALRLSGTLTTLTGTALNWGGAALQAKDESDAFGVGLQAAGTAATVAGSAIGTLAPVLSTLGVTIGTLMPWIGVAVAAIGLIVGVVQLVKNASPEGQLKKTQKAAEEAAVAAEEAAQAYNGLVDSLESLEGKEATLNELTKGTKEWKVAVSELNNEVLALIEKYPELAAFVESQNGILSFNKTESVNGKTYNDIISDYEKAAIYSRSAEVANKINVEKKQQTVDYNNLSAATKELTALAVKGTATEYFVNSDGRRFTHDEFILEQGKYGIDEADAETQWNNAILETDIDYEDSTKELAKAIASGNWGENYSAEVEKIGQDSEVFNELKAYGQKILASESAIDTFTQSLINAALINTNISEEQKDAIDGLYNTDIIQKRTDQEEDKIKRELESEETKEGTKIEYAKKKGYQYADGKFYSGKGENKKEVVVLDEDIVRELAGIRTQENMTEEMNRIGPVIEQLSNGANEFGQVFSNIASKSDGMGLTLDSFAKLENLFDENGNIKEDDSSFKALKEQLTGGDDPLFSEEEFYSIIRNAYEKAIPEITAVQERLQSAGVSGDLFKDTEIDIGSLSSIADKIYDVFILSGDEAANSLANTIKSTLDGIKDPEKAKNFAEALNRIDWSDAENIDNLDSILEELGLTGLLSAEDIDKLKKEIKSAGRAANKFDLEKLKEEIQQTEDLVKDIEGREDNERTFTKKQRDLMVEANPKLEGQLIPTGLDEFVFIGDSMTTLVEALNKNTEAVLGKNAEEANTAAAQSQKWVDAMEKNVVFAETRNPVTKELETKSDSFSNIIDKVLNNKETGNDELVAVLKTLGEDTTGTKDQLIERIKLLFEKYYGTDGETAKTNIDNADIINRAALAKKTPEELSGMVGDGKNDEAELDALKAMATQAGVTEKEINKYKKALSEAGLKGKDLEAAALQQATAIKKQQKAINEASQEIADQLTIMDKSKKGSVTYNEALGKIPQQLEKAFGFKVPEDWLNSKENLKLVKDWAAGSEAAGEKIRNSLSNNLKGAMESASKVVGQESQEMINWLNTFSGTEVWITASMDNQGVMTSVTESEQAAQDLANTLKAQGFHTEIKTTYKTQVIPNIAEPWKGDTTIQIPQYEVTWVDTNKKTSGGSPFDAPPSYTPPKNTGGKKTGGGKTKKEKWENPYDKQYNTVQKINNELRKREKLEKRYQNLIAKSGTNAVELQKNSEKEIKSIRKEMKLREKLLQKRKDEMKKYENKNKKYEKYAYYDEEQGRVVINWDEINKVKDPKKGEAIKEYIEGLENLEEQIEKEEDALDEQTELLRGIYDRGKDEYFDLEQKIKEALINDRQKEIDRLNAINDSINDTNSRLIDAMQSSIDKYRQDRENERTEKELSDKQRRLAYLQQDTSGANALEIMQLQEEIEQGTEDYTDTLIDQKINELQQQNDEAAEQRERQIELMQAQLDKWSESGEIWDQVYNLMESGIDENGIIIGSDLYKLLAENDEYVSMSNLEKLKWAEELKDQVAQAVAWLSLGNSTEALINKGELKEGQEMTFTTSDGKTVTGVLQKNGDVIDSEGNVYTNIHRNERGEWITDEEFKTKEETETPPPPPPPAKTKPTELEKKGVGAAIFTDAVGYGWGNGQTRKDRLKEVFGKDNNIQDKYVKVSNAKAIKDEKNYTYNKMKKKYKNGVAYKTGGLADFTGPAWLDGTKSKPEYVLNADQTKAFFTLVDVLEGLKAGVTQSSHITGDSIYDVDINVETIGNDYDVEQLASTVKKLITDEARYRNNNIINLSR